MKSCSEDHKKFRTYVIVRKNVLVNWGQSKVQELKTSSEKKGEIRGKIILTKMEQNEYEKKMNIE